MELACERISEEEIGKLRQACDNFAEITKTQDAVQIAQADVELHDISYREAGTKSWRRW